MAKNKSRRQEIGRIAPATTTTTTTSIVDRDASGVGGSDSQFKMTATVTHSQPTQHPRDTIESLKFKPPQLLSPYKEFHNPQQWTRAMHPLMDQIDYFEKGPYEMEILNQGPRTVASPSTWRSGFSEKVLSLAELPDRSVFNDDESLAKVKEERVEAAKWIQAGIDTSLYYMWNCAELADVFSKKPPWTNAQQQPDQQEDQQASGAAKTDAIDTPLTLQLLTQITKISNDHGAAICLLNKGMKLKEDLVQKMTDDAASLQDKLKRVTAELETSSRRESKMQDQINELIQQAAESERKNKELEATLVAKTDTVKRLENDINTIQVERADEGWKTICFRDAQMDVSAAVAALYGARTGNDDCLAWLSLRSYLDTICNDVTLISDLKSEGTRSEGNRLFTIWDRLKSERGYRDGCRRVFTAAIQRILNAKNLADNARQRTQPDGNPQRHYASEITLEICSPYAQFILSPDPVNDVSKDDALEEVAFNPEALSRLIGHLTAHSVIRPTEKTMSPEQMIEQFCPIVERDKFLRLYKAHSEFCNVIKKLMDEYKEQGERAQFIKPLLPWMFDERGDPKNY